MKGNDSLNILRIQRNWISVQKLKTKAKSKSASKSTSKSKTETESKSKYKPTNSLLRKNEGNYLKDNINKNVCERNKIEKGKIKKGKIENKETEEKCFHVFVRGYNSYSIFYNDEDRVHFLLILDEETKKREARISAFILMDNHFHLQIITSQLQEIMRGTLYRYSRRIKKKYGIEGPIFNKNFGRSVIYSYLLLKENLLYILSNASRENICPTHRDYLWSSYNCHPEVIHLRSIRMLPLLEKTVTKEISGQNFLPEPKKRRGPAPSKERIAKTDISRVITVDESFMIKSYKNLEELDLAIFTYTPLKKQLKKPNPFYEHRNNYRPSNWVHKVTPDYQITSLFLELLNGRKFNTISERELIQIANILRREKRATNRQISNTIRKKNNLY
ncbi:MAG: hypothetical protein PHE99_02765 [Bacteroidales bacterium]|nr:hypothetical protein [Bacteroidales bacterium]